MIVMAIVVTVVIVPYPDPMWASSGSGSGFKVKSGLTRLARLQLLGQELFLQSRAVEVGLGWALDSEIKHSFIR